MTHDELLAKINETEPFLYSWQPYESVQFIARRHLFALRAVIELHKPKSMGETTELLGEYECRGCAKAKGFAIYPCKTIRAIEKELS